MAEIRPGLPTDAPATAAIRDAWTEESDWLPRLKSLAEIEEAHRISLFEKNEVYMIGAPLEGYIALSPDNFVQSLFCRTRGRGLGKALLDHAKGQRPTLHLWCFVANTRARRFYEREGFAEQRRAEDESDEGLPDILYRWEAA